MLLNVCFGYWFYCFKVILVEGDFLRFFVKGKYVSMGEDEER